MDPRCDLPVSNPHCFGAVYIWASDRTAAVDEHRVGGGGGWILILWPLGAREPLARRALSIAPRRSYLRRPEPITTRLSEINFGNLIPVILLGVDPQKHLDPREHA